MNVSVKDSDTLNNWWITFKTQKKQRTKLVCNFNKKNYNMILSCYNYGRVTIIYDTIVNYWRY